MNGISHFLEIPSGRTDVAPRFFFLLFFLFSFLLVMLLGFGAESWLLLRSITKF